MKSKAILGSLAAMLAISCATATNPAADYNVKVILTPDEDGMQLYMTDYDSGAKIDSAIVENGTATMSGNIQRPTQRSHRRLPRPARRLHRRHTARRHRKQIQRRD